MSRGGGTVSGKARCVVAFACASEWTAAGHRGYHNCSFAAGVSVPPDHRVVVCLGVTHAIHPDVCMAWTTPYGVLTPTLATPGKTFTNCDFR